MTDRHYGHGKGDRALELFEKGLDTAQIAERLGTNRRVIATMLCHARAKREKELERAGKLADAMGHNV
jgi:transcriptional regulator